MPKRSVAAVTEPERASDTVIERCRREIEGSLKRFVRTLVIPMLRWRYGVAEIGEGFHWPKGGRALIGAGSRIGRFAYIGPGFESHGPIVVGDLCMIAAECLIIGADHLFDIADTPTRLGFPIAPRRVTTFGVDAWIGARVIIMEGVSVGAGAVVGSGSLVIRDVEPYTVVAGVPAKLIRKRLDDDEIAGHDRTVCAAPRSTGVLQ